MNAINNANTTRVAAPVMNAVQMASTRTGIDFDYLVDVARVESRFDPSAKAATSSARGLYQFTKQTWLATLKRHGNDHGLGWASDAIDRDSSGRFNIADPLMRDQILSLRDDPAAAATMAGALTADNREHLESRLGRAAETVDLYLAHFLGSAGAVKFLSALDADPGQAGATLLPEAAAANRAIFYDSNGSMRSLAEIRDNFRVKLDADGGAVLQPAPSQGWSAAARSSASGGGGGRPPITMMDIQPMPKKLSMGFAADAYRRLASMTGGDA